MTRIELGAPDRRRRALGSAVDRGNVAAIEIPLHKRRNVGADIYGVARLELAKLVKLALDRAGVVWFLDGGTLLGAFRNGEQIGHDDDFDIATYIPNFKGDEDLVALKEVVVRLLPAPYEARLVTSYASKLEVYDPASELYLLPLPYHDVDFHTVTVDIQVMTDGPDGFVVYLHDMLRHVRVPMAAIEPTGHILCAGVEFRSPSQPARFLEAQYGYIGADARYDSPTKMYVKADAPKA